MVRLHWGIAPSSPLEVLRLVVLVVCLLTLLSAGQSVLAYDAGTRTATPDAADPVVVAAIDGVGPGQIVAYDADGQVAYHDNSLWLYHDVDPSPAGAHTVTYVASDLVDSDSCATEECVRNVIERANLSTGEVTRLASWDESRNGSVQIHDIERLEESVFLIADISYPDRVYAVNVTTGETRWEWRVAEAYDTDSGGAYPSDWTHVNDVEVLSDGRVMINLRNQDQVVFLRPEEGIQHNWTLGSDDDHGTLYEPHNPDYIPESRGGPAVLVADSENNRLVEYQRENGSWTRTWHWQDTRLQWPRDADRLPSGRTLVADSHGKRMLSVAPSGRIVWSREFPPGSYDVELLGTGAESTGGASASVLSLQSRWPATAISDSQQPMERATIRPSLSDDTSARAANATTAVSDGSTRHGDGAALNPAALRHRVVSLVPPLVLHGLLWALPPWATAGDATLLLATGIVTGGWFVVEAVLRVLSMIRARRGSTTPS